MQHNIAGGDIELLDGTICLLTPGSHPGDQVPRHSERQVVLADLPCRTRSTYSVLSTCSADSHHQRIPYRAKQFYPSKRVPYRLGCWLGLLFVRIREPFGRKRKIASTQGRHNALCVAPPIVETAPFSSAS